MLGELEDWFKNDVLVHEEVLMRYLSRAWPYRAEHEDLRQEVYARAYEAALTTRPRFPKAFIFSIARHVMSDRRRRERIVSIQAAGDTDFSNDLVDEKTPESSIDSRQELARLAHAFDQLPDRCREVIWLRRVYGMSQKEVARALGIAEKTVENQVAKASRLIALHLQSPDLASSDRHGAEPQSHSRHASDVEEGE